MYPILLDLRDQPCLVVGAGQVAYRQLQSLLAEHARVTVVAPEVTAPIAQLADEAVIVLRKRPFTDEDVNGFQLVLVATGEPDIDQRVTSAAKRRGVCVSMVDASALCEPVTSGTRATTTAKTGQVALVGAGPGHPGLLTVRGLDLLRAADAVVYDRLAIPAIPLDLPDRIELIGVGKESGHHPVPQDEINQILLRLARDGKRVVRLKGGDPFVFARGGEEAVVLRAHGIPCEVVPGVTAGIAAPAAAGIPVTFRREAVRLTFITAHEGGTPRVRWDLLAQDQHATLIGYMGVSNLAEVQASLMAAGMNGETPAALIERATLPDQRSLRTSLAELPEAAARAHIQSPAIFVIGRVVAHAEEIASDPSSPLRGLRVGVFAPACRRAIALRSAGAEILVAPKPLTAAARLVLGTGSLSGWLVRNIDELKDLERERSGAPFLAKTPLWCGDANLADAAHPGNWADVVVVDGGEDQPRPRS